MIPVGVMYGVYLYDPFVKVIHFLLAASIVCAIIMLVVYTLYLKDPASAWVDEYDKNELTTEIIKEGKDIIGDKVKTFVYGVIITSVLTLILPSTSTVASAVIAHYRTEALINHVDMTEFDNMVNKQFESWKIEMP